MEYLMQWEFWQEIGLTVAARLSVVAVALWAVKMTMDSLRQPVVGRKAVPQAQPAPLPEAGAWFGQPANERIKAYYSPESHHRPLTFRRPDPAPSEPTTPWREKMAKYLAGEPVLSAGGPRRPR